MPATAYRPFVAPARLPLPVRLQAEALWASATHGTPGASFMTDDYLADLLGLGPGDGHDELTRCEYDRCGAWLWADEGAILAYASGTELTVCAAHAVPDDPGARVYPGAALEAAWRAAEGGEIGRRLT